MPVDMMIEAMKVAYTKSKSRYSMASLMSKSSLPQVSLLGHLDLHSTLYRTIPGPSTEALNVDKGHKFSVSFSVKFYGSGTIRHYSDFEGSQILMDKFVSKQHTFPTNLRQFAKKYTNKHSRCILAFTESGMQIFSDNNQVFTDKIPLDQVYAVHPHPTKGRVFGIMADHSSSGTVHSFCFTATSTNTSADVLCAFREACMHWLSINLERENLEEEKKTKEIKCLKVDRETVDTYLASLFSFAGLCEKKSKIDLGAKSLESVCCGAEGEISSRKVSFSSAQCLVDKVVCSKEENCGYHKYKHVEASNERNACFENNSKCKLYKLEPRLPPRFFPAPSPPSKISRCKHSHPLTLSDSMPDVTSQEDSSSLDVKQKLLALNIQEDAPHNDGTYSSFSPVLTENSQASSLSENGDDKAMNKLDVSLSPMFMFHSTPESDVSTGGTITSKYFTPFQSFHEYPCCKRCITPEDNNNSSCASTSASYSIHSTSSAPSFLIHSSTQLRQCFMDDSSITDFKAYLQKMSEEVKLDMHISDYLKMSGEDKYDVHSPEIPKTVDDEIHSPESLMSGFVQLEDIQSQSGDDISLNSNFRDSHEGEPGKRPSTSELDSESESEVSTEHKLYRDIPLGELLDKLYPVINASILSDKDYEFCHPHGSDDEDSQYDESDSYIAAEPLMTSIDEGQTSCTSTTSETVEVTQVAYYFYEDDTTSKTYSVNNSDNKILSPDIHLDESLRDNDTDSQTSSTTDDRYELPLIDIDDNSKDSSGMVGKTYSINDEDSVFTIPSLPLESVADASTESYSPVYSLLDSCDKENNNSSRATNSPTTSMELEGESNITFLSLPQQDSNEYQYLTASNISSSNYSVKTIPSSLPLKCESIENISSSEPTFKTSSSPDTKDSFCTIPSLPLKIIYNDDLGSNSATAENTASDAATDTDTSFPSQTVELLEQDESPKIIFTTDSNDIVVDSAIPSLTLKIKAWSSSKNNSPSRPYKTYSTPANLGSTSARNNGIAITVMEPPKLVCNGPNAKLSEEKLKRNSGSSVSSSLQYVTELLESSHDSLAKSVHSLCQRAIIKQSNISLELVLPIEELSKPNDAAASFSRIESHLAKLQLNSYTVYTSELQDEVERKSNVLDEELK